MQDTAEVWLKVGADERSSVEDGPDVFEAFADSDAIDSGRDGGESRLNVGHAVPFGVGQVAFGIEVIRCGHAASHPEKNARVGFCCGVYDLFRSGGGFRGHETGEPGSGEFAEEIAARFRGVNGERIHGVVFLSSGPDFWLQRLLDTLEFGKIEDRPEDVLNGLRVGFLSEHFHQCGPLWG